MRELSFSLPLLSVRVLFDLGWVSGRQHAMGLVLYSFSYTLSFCWSMYISVIIVRYMVIAIIIYICVFFFLPPSFLGVRIAGDEQLTVS